MTSKQAKEIAIESYLEKLGFIPKYNRKNGNELWYNSPFKADKTPSFKITLSLNTWYDFSLAKGGTLIDFLMEYYQCGVGEAFNKLSSNEFAKIDARPEISITQKESNIELRSIKELNNPKLIEYVQKRGIKVEFAAQYLKEIYYRYESKSSNYFAVGMKNISDGYEVRCDIFKGCLVAKDISIIQVKNNDSVSVFEGLFDFLSLLTEQNTPSLKTDVIILNSVILIPNALEFSKAMQYKKAYLFFDNDISGDKATSEFKESFNGATKDMRYLFTGFKDYNEN